MVLLPTGIVEKKIKFESSKVRADVVSEIRQP